MKVVPDSNILLSAVISEGAPFEIINLAFDGQIQLVFSRATFGEFADVLMTRGQFSELTREARGAYIGRISEIALWVRAEAQPVECRDPGDQPFLDLAVSSDADFLITGDPDLLVIGQVARTKIVTPKAFMAVMRSILASEGGEKPPGPGNL